MAGDIATYPDYYNNKTATRSTTHYICELCGNLTTEPTRICCVCRVTKYRYPKTMGGGYLNA